VPEIQELADLVCKYKKLITLPKLRDALREEKLRSEWPTTLRSGPECRSSARSRSADPDHERSEK
jgi:hypothetical protein